MLRDRKEKLLKFYNKEDKLFGHRERRDVKASAEGIVFKKFMRMHSKFKLYTIFNGIIHVIFLLNILIYFNNGYVKMQLTEKAEKNGEWIWNFTLAFITSLFSSWERPSWWNSKHDLHFEEGVCTEKESERWVATSWENLWNEVMPRASFYMAAKKDYLWQHFFSLRIL